jgi:hypothetical protein
VILLSQFDESVKTAIFKVAGDFGLCFRTQHFGSLNPNWHGGLLTKRCIVCGDEFVGIEKRKACSVECGRISRSRMITGNGNHMRRNNPERFTLCRFCGAEFSQSKSKAKYYCSLSCWGKSSRQSPYQLWVATQLEQRGFQVELEKSFDWLRSPVSNHKLRLDVFLPNENVAIEVDGRHHYDVTARDFVITQVRDQAKNQLLDQHGVPLIRIRRKITTENLLQLVNTRQSIVV